MLLTTLLFKLPFLESPKFSTSRNSTYIGQVARTRTAATKGRGDRSQIRQFLRPGAALYLSTPLPFPHEGVWPGSVCTWTKEQSPLIPHLLSQHDLKTSDELEHLAFVNQVICLQLEKDKVESYSHLSQT